MIAIPSNYDSFLADSDDDFAVGIEPRRSSAQRGRRELSGQAKFQRKARFGRKSSAPGMSQTGLHRRRFRKGSLA